MGGAQLVLEPVHPEARDRRREDRHLGQHDEGGRQQQEPGRQAVHRLGPQRSCPPSMTPGTDSSKKAGFPECSPLRSGTNLSARSEEHTSELQSLMRISYAVFCLKKKTIKM